MCSQYSLLQTVVEACQKKQQCRVPPAVGKYDPCPGHPKFIQVDYKCRPCKLFSVWHWRRALQTKTHLCSGCKPRPVGASKCSPRKRLFTFPPPRPPPAYTVVFKHRKKIEEKYDAFHKHDVLIELFSHLRWHNKNKNGQKPIWFVYYVRVLNGRISS